tara:strand:- start:809 stop:1987 length:1179 start_codon:yes stop_codon:yes gene_type:complete
MKKEYDVIIVGGGPSGSMAAIEIAKANLSVCILDRKTEIGSPVRCGEAIGFSGLNNFFKPKSSWIASKINSINLVSPNSTNVKVIFKNETGYILNRIKFDSGLSDIAKNNGADIFTNANVTGLIYEDDFICGVKVNYLGKEKLIKSKLVIGADGIESRVGRWGKIKTLVRMKDMESCIQYSVSNIKVENKEMCMYMGQKYAPGGYLWIFPKGGDRANIGIGISGKYSKHKSAKKYLDEFIRNNFSLANIDSVVCGGVICASPIKEPVNNGLMLIGDAAHQTNPMTGGGISSGMKAGVIAGKVAVESVNLKRYNKDFLMKYPKLMFKEFGNRYEKLYKIKETVNKLSDLDLDGIAANVEKVPIDKRTLATVFKKAVYKKPSLIFDVLKIYSGF